MVPPRRTWRECSRCRKDSTRRRRADPVRRRGDRAGAAGVAGRPDARVRLRPLVDACGSARDRQHALSFYGQHEHRKLMLGRAARDSRRSLRRGAAARATGGTGGGPTRASGPREQQARSCGRSPARATGSWIWSRSSSMRSRPLRRARRRRPSCSPSEIACGISRPLRGARRRRRGDRAGGAVRRRGALALAAAAQQLEPTADIDRRAGPAVGALQALRFEAEDLGGELRGYLLGSRARRAARGGRGAAGAARPAAAQARRIDRRCPASCRALPGAAGGARGRGDRLGGAAAELAGDGDELDRLGGGAERRSQRRAAEAL